jgi:xylan 1,4-beta-xylosidase
LALDSDSALFTRRQDGSFVLALWSYDQTPGKRPGSLTVKLKNIAAHHATVWQLDQDHGNILRAYAKLGSPRYPIQSQLRELRHAAGLPEPKSYEIRNHELHFDVPGPSLILVEVK